MDDYESEYKVVILVSNEQNYAEYVSEFRLPTLFLASVAQEHIIQTNIY